MGSDEKMIGNTPSIIEWLKWLSFVPQFEQEYIQELMSKKVGEISPNEREEIKRDIKLKNMTVLFKRYVEGICTERESLQVEDFMRNNSIVRIMLSKLTKEEIEYAKKTFINLSQIPEADLSRKIDMDSRPENYWNLPMADAFVLHKISELNSFRRSIKDSEEIAKKMYI